jgi:CDP-diacylglycerol--serine O-phosphatidyltransferase
MAERRAPPAYLYALPAAFTLGTALCGFAAIAMLTTPAGYGPAAWLILGAWVCDMADGLVARFTRTTSAFGAQLDSLCDAVGFGVAPAVLVGLHGPGTSAPFGWLAGGALLVAVLVRLARFNVLHQEEEGGHLYFSGLPSPAAGVSIAALTLSFGWLRSGHWLVAKLPPTLALQLSNGLESALPLVALAVAVLMVSGIRYADLPKHYLRKLKPRWHLVLLAVLAAAISPEPVLAAFFIGYLALAPLLSLARLLTAPPSVA